MNAEGAAINPLSPELAAILLCPETKQSLRLMSGAELEALNAKIRGGGLRNRGGVLLQEPLREALLRDDGRVAYPVDGGIPVMLIEESIAV